MKPSKRELIDELLNDAADTALKDLVGEYPSLEELEGKYTFSNKHNRKMKRLFKKADRLEDAGNVDAWHTFRRMSFNAAAVLCMVFTIFTLVAFTVPEIRVAITNYIVERNEEYVVINTESNMYNGQVIEGAPKYIPEGFEIVDYMSAENTIIVTYENNNSFIYYIRNTGDVSVTVDNELSDFDEISIDKFTGYICEKNNEITIIFHDGTYTYHISSNLDRETLLNIAVSIIR